MIGIWSKNKIPYYFLRDGEVPGKKLVFIELLMAIFYKLHLSV